MDQEPGSPPSQVGDAEYLSHLVHLRLPQVKRKAREGILELAAYFLKDIHTAQRSDHGLIVRESSHLLCNPRPVTSPLWASFPRL